MMKNLTAFLFFVILIVSCQKEDVALVDTKSFYPFKVYNASHKLITDYQYNSDNQLTTINNYDTLGTKVAYSKYLYENKRFVGMKSYSNGTLTGMTTYEYSVDGRVIKTNNYKTDSTTILGYSSYEYDLNNNVSKVIFYLNNTLSHSIRYTFQNGDLVTLKYYNSIDSLQATLYYQYDDKPNVFCKFPSIIPRGHNQISYSSPNAINGALRIVMGNLIINLGQTNTARYAYDSNGLVISKTVIYTNPLIKTEYFNYEYIKQ